MFSAHTLSALSDALAIPADHPHAPARLRDAISMLCAEARVIGLHAEDVVGAIKSAWSESPLPPGWNELQWRARYEHALAWGISMYFDEAEPTV
jgi:hypothetical protein